MKIKHELLLPLLTVLMVGAVLSINTAAQEERMRGYGPEHWGYDLVPA